jgi:ATP-binding cassette subfamily B protein
MSRDLRRDLFKKVESFSKAEFDKFSTASLITRTTNDITQVQMLIIMSMRMIFYAPIIGAGAIIRAVDKSVSMTWVIALAVVILLGLISVVFSVALPKFKIIQKLVDRLNLVTREALSGMMVIRAFKHSGF